MSRSNRCLMTVWILSLFLSAPQLVGEARAGRYYSIQIAACRELKCATEMVETLKKLGHNAFYRQEAVKGKGKWYRVYVEKFPTRKEAEKEARLSRELGLISEYKVRAVEEKNGESPVKAKTGGEVVFLHVSSCEQAVFAEKAVKELETSGVKAFFLEEEVQGKKWFRVYVGEYADEAEARKAGKALKAKGAVDYFKPITIDKRALVKDSRE